MLFKFSLHKYFGCMLFEEFKILQATLRSLKSFLVFEIKLEIVLKTQFLQKDFSAELITVQSICWRVG